MGLAKNEGFLLIFMAFLGFTMGATVYQVGESAGWSVAGNVDYGKWASSKTFQVNDTLQKLEFFEKGGRFYVFSPTHLEFSHMPALLKQKRLGIVFKFDPQYHNVLQVSRSDFHSCDATAPIATYSTGNDSFFIRSSGHYFFFCGFLGHCQAGQKVDIRVPKSIGLGHVGVPVGSPIQPPQASPDGPAVPSPSSGESIICSNKIWLLLVFLMWDLF